MKAAGARCEPDPPRPIPRLANESGRMVEISFIVPRRQLLARDLAQAATLRQQRGAR